MVNIKHMVWEPMKYLTFLISSHEYSSCALSEENRMLVYSFKYPSKEIYKILKNETAEPYLDPSQIPMMEHFCENTTAKSFVIDV